MEIEIKNEYRVEVELSDAELTALGVPYTALDYARIETRRAVQTIAGELRAAGVDFDFSGRVLIEALRTDGGCRLCFSALPGAAPRSVKQLVKRPPLPALLVCPDARSAALARRALGGQANAKPYETGRGTLLYITDAPSEAALLRAAEYGELTTAEGALVQAYLEEHFGGAE